MEQHSNTDRSGHEQLYRLLIKTPFGIKKYSVRLIWQFLWYSRIEAIETILLPTKRLLMPGERAWVPSSAVYLASASQLTPT